MSKVDIYTVSMCIFVHNEQIYIICFSTVFYLYTGIIVLKIVSVFVEIRLHLSLVVGLG